MSDGTGETGAMHCNECSAPLWGCHCACIKEIANLRAELEEKELARGMEWAAFHKLVCEMRARDLCTENELQELISIARPEGVSPYVDEIATLRAELEASIDAASDAILMAIDDRSATHEECLSAYSTAIETARSKGK